MKTKLLFTKNANLFFGLLLSLLCMSFSWSQTNLVLNGNCEAHTVDVNDNADAFDMTPPSGIDGGTNNSPYNALWNNSALDAYLNTAFGDDSEQPGSSGDGNKFGPNAGTGRGVKLNEVSRRIYQKITVVAGTQYTFSVDSRSEATGALSGVYILNEEIDTEVGLQNLTADSRVDAYYLINNDYNPTKSSSTLDTFTTNTFTFTPTTTTAVIYIGSATAADATTEIFFDNISVIETSQLSTTDVNVLDFKVYPNPAKDHITIASHTNETIAVSVFDVLGKNVLNRNLNANNTLNVSGLSKGLYVMKITSASNSVITKKIIIE